MREVFCGVCLCTWCVPMVSVKCVWLGVCWPRSKDVSLHVNEHGARVSHTSLALHIALGLALCETLCVRTVSSRKQTLNTTHASLTGLMSDALETELESNEK